MNARELHTIVRIMRCDCCGAPLGDGEAWYELPDGFDICAESDCLQDWAAAYFRRRTALEEEEER